MTVADAYSIGDRFEVLDDGVSIGLTSEPVGRSDCGASPDNCMAAGASYGAFQLSAGDHVITILAVASPFGIGAGYFRIDGDVQAADTDGDGVLDSADRCPRSNPQGFDADRDGCRDLLADLRVLAETSPMDEQSRQALLAKVDSAGHLLCTVDNEKGGLLKLQDFREYVKAQSGKKIAPATAAALDSFALSLVSEIGDGWSVCQLA